MSILNRFGIVIDGLDSGSKSVGFETPVVGGLGNTVRNLRNQPILVKKLDALALIPDKLTKDAVVKATNSANRALAQNKHKAKYLKAITSEFNAVALNLKMEATAKQQMMGVLDGTQQALDVYGRAVDDSMYDQDILEAGYVAYREELSNGSKANLSGY